MGLASDVIANLPALRIVRTEEKTNIFELIGSLTAIQIGFFATGWLAWTCDAIDFFSVSLSVTRLSTQFAVSTASVTTSITLTLLFRPVGAIIFGLVSDRYGRKWPLVVNLMLVAVLSLATAYTTNFHAFLAVRSLFGIGMGGIWGLAVSCALENLPVGLRGLASGILQQGYAVGYLVAAVINLTAVPHLNRWQILFEIAAAISLVGAIARAALPESQYFLDRRAADIANGSTVSAGSKSKIFITEAGRALKLHWVRCIYAILLMTGMNFFSHGSQDLYTTILVKTKGLDAHSATIATIIGNLGAIVGGTIAGGLSQYFGRRLIMIVCCMWVLVFLPLWLLPTTFSSLAAGAFFLQMGVQGAWGVVPILLTEISPLAFRASFPGIAYQIGNMISSASAQIEATAGENIKTSSGAPDYGKVATILIGVVAGYLIILLLLGREDHGSHFENGKAAFEIGGGADEVDANGHEFVSHDAEKGSVEEKGSVREEEEVGKA